MAEHGCENSMGHSLWIPYGIKKGSVVQVFKLGSDQLYVYFICGFGWLVWLVGWCYVHKWLNLDYW